MLKTIKILMLLSFTAITMGLSACNTIEGAGRDIENAGEAVQDSAE